VGLPTKKVSSPFCCGEKFKIIREFREVREVSDVETKKAGNADIN
jgi:hypothetical protein